MRRLDLKSKKMALAAVFCLMIHAGAGYSLHATGPIEIPQFQWVRPGSLILNPPDMGRIRAEDEQSRENIVPLRIGIHRELPPVSFDDGDIDFDSAGNMVWRLSITSSGAKNTRLYLVMSDLQVSDCVEVISDQGEGELYTREDTGRNSGIWTWSTEGETSLILWHHATNAGRTGIPDELPFRIVYLAHAYRNRPDQPDGDAREGNCHNDATCDTAYLPQRDASAYIEFQDGGWYVCSGTMLNDTIQDFRPFFMTANHCISTDTVAQTVQVFFFYRTNVCNSGSASYGASKNGAHLRAHGSTSSQSDFALLELTSTGFNGIYFAGWERTVLSTGEAITSMHHPDGAYRRISYGHITGTSSNFWETTWDRTSNPGVTEPGSSGGGLFRDSTHRFIGQLYGGSSACGSGQYYPDYYGRFDKSFNYGTLSQWLGDATSIDGAYYNSSPSTPTPTGTNTPTGTPVPAGTPTPLPFSPTPAWSSTPCVTATPAPQCSETGCSISIPSTDLSPGDVFYCQIFLCNLLQEPIMNANLFAVLEIGESFFFAPSFEGYDSIPISVEPGYYPVTILHPFEWPQISSNGNAVWYACLTDQEVTTVIGNYDSIGFKWHP